MEGKDMTQKTLKELYLSSISRFAELPCASVYEGEELTFGDFAERVDQLILTLKGAGLVQGDKVALLSNNMPNWSVCYFATVVSGMVIVPILPDFSPSELEMILEHAEVKALCVSDKLFAKVSKETVDRLNIVIRTKNIGAISQLVEVEFDPNEIYEPQEEDLAAIIYTSGTTSTPKGVMLSHRNLSMQVLMEIDLFPIYTTDIFLSILPLSHTYECSVGMLYPFSQGTSVVYLDKLPTPSTLMPALKSVRPTAMLSVPLIIEKIYRSQIVTRFNKTPFKKRLYSIGLFRKIIHRLAGIKLKSTFGGRLRFFGVGGAKLEEQTERFLIEAHFPYGIGYGLTETAPLIAGGIPGKIRFRSTGPVLKGVQARLENVKEETGEGEIVVLSPSTMMGYYKNPEATKQVFTEDGWFRTKDLGVFDKHENLYIKGRLDNMIVGAGGENIYPEEIESVINSHFLVTDSIVKEERGQLVAMVQFNREELERRYQILKEELGMKMEDIKSEVLNYVNSKVGRFARISEVEVQEDFEKTPTHKIKRFKYDKKVGAEGKKVNETEENNEKKKDKKIDKRRSKRRAVD